MRVTVHTLGGSLMLYHDGGCRALVKSLLAALCQHYGECVCVFWERTTVQCVYMLK